MKNESFESALLKLEAIIKEMETGEINLEDSIEKYKKATKLLKLCDEKLKSATETVNKVLNNKGEFEDFDVNE